ncbi:hypothetical protein NQ317_006091 [Molorchus minor]|uniref:Uncharacterized protein n=1 Tax=Molorchus minor TaxID=1323400 RepID=A0ABQ9ITE6_9CUCU|nr:hypothetical protein NQ317_006091 [Molorchus minor]
MLKATINLHDNITEKSKILSKDEIDVFLNDAPDDIYLMMKETILDTLDLCQAVKTTRRDILKC